MSAAPNPREMFTRPDCSAQIAAGAKLTGGRDAMLVSMHPEELRETMEALGCTTQSALAAAIEKRRLAVEADVTVSFHGPKIGYDRPGAERWTGRVEVGDVGVPEPVLRRHASPRAGRA